MLITLVNEFHNTEAKIRGTVGGKVSRDVVRDAEKKLCGIPECTCSGYAGVRGGRYSIARTGHNLDEYVVVDNEAGGL